MRKLHGFQGDSRGIDLRLSDDTGSRDSEESKRSDELHCEKWYTTTDEKVDGRGMIRGAERAGLNCGLSNTDARFLIKRPIKQGQIMAPKPRIFSLEWKISH